MSTDNRPFARAARAHDIAEALNIPFGAAWRVANCVMKSAYATEEDAAFVANRWKDSHPQTPYRCDICGRWHLSSGNGSDEGV